MAGRDVTVRWRERMLFEGGASGKPAILVDGNGAEATSPVELLLLAAATCSAADVVSILEKQRVGLKALDIQVRGTRRDAQPRRYTSIHFSFAVSGEGADEAKARRAIDLSIEKYCSVLASFAPDIPVTYDLVIR
ncbi:MAG TPA: OsmC family protein [Gemmatimonadales bacterium]|nr:OsmC family protein [Gemmatimonadales bacterium]